MGLPAARAGGHNGAGCNCCGAGSSKNPSPSLKSPMASTRLLASLGLAATLLAPSPAPAADGLRPKHRLRRMSEASSMQSPRPPATDAPDCGLIPGVPEILGDQFDPANFDEISVAGHGKLLAYATQWSSAGTPLPFREIVVLRQSGPLDPDRVTRVGEADGHDDQPSIRFDRLGNRMAFRGASADGLESNIFLRSTEGEDVTTLNITRIGEDPPGNGVSPVGLAFEPSLAPRVIKRDLGGDITRTERDARIAFVSTADLDKGKRSLFADRDGRNSLVRPG